MLRTKERNAEPIPGYRLIEPLGRGGFGEVWKCEAPGGLFKAIKFVSGDAAGLDGDKAAATELKAIEHIKSIRHPFLLSMDRVEVIDGELLIVMELADKNLLDLLHARQADGHQGLDRYELLGYLGEAANVLDHMNLQHGLQHLDVKPANLFLVAQHVKVADFGLVHSLASHPSGSVTLAALTPLYAAPELFHNKVSKSCDQYSLAVVYQELLTGKVPFFGKNMRQLMLLHTVGQPNLEPLPEIDRPIIARALSKDPAERFSNCTELINALFEGAGQPAASRGQGSGVRRLSIGSSGEWPVVTGQKLEVGTQAPSEVTSSNHCSLGAGHCSRPAQGKYVPEYQFEARLGRTPWSESWQGVSSDQRRWLIRLLFGAVGWDPRREQDAIERLHRLEHSLVPSIHLVRGGPGCLIAVTEKMDASWRERWLEARQAGKEGLPRDKLLDWLWKVAEVLDELNRQEGLCHFGLTPRHLFFKNNRIQIMDLGMNQLLWQPAGLLQGQLQPRYAAPELTGSGIAGLVGARPGDIATAAAEIPMAPHVVRSRQRNGPETVAQQASAATVAILEAVMDQAADQPPGEMTMPLAPHKRNGQVQAPPQTNAMPEQSPSGPLWGPASDQYSLAVIYQEMLTGQPPFRSRRMGEPNLESLPACDRAVIARALDAVPAKRFRTCRDLIEALDAAGVARPQASRILPKLPDTAALAEILAELLTEAGCRSPIKESGTWLTLPQGSQVLRACFCAGLSMEKPATAFESFCKQWKAELVRTAKDSLVYQVGPPARPWKRLFGQPPGLLVEIQWVPAQPPATPLPELTVHVRPRANAPEDQALLRQIGMVLLESLQGQLNGQHERRAHERRLWTQPVQVTFQLPDGGQSEIINCVGKDVSLTGMGLYVPCQPPGSEVRLAVTSRARRQPMYLGGSCVRVQKCGDGWYELGVKIL